MSEESPIMEYTRKMLEAYDQMSEEDRQQLHAFEGEHLEDGISATSDWPGVEEVHRQTAVEEIGLPSDVE